MHIATGGSVIAVGAVVDVVGGWEGSFRNQRTELLHGHQPRAQSRRIPRDTPTIRSNTREEIAKLFHAGSRIELLAQNLLDDLQIENVLHAAALPKGVADFIAIPAADLVVPDGE